MQHYSKLFNHIPANPESKPVHTSSAGSPLSVTVILCLNSFFYRSNQYSLFSFYVCKREALLLPQHSWVSKILFTCFMISLDFRNHCVSEGWTVDALTYTWKANATVKLSLQSQMKKKHQSQLPPLFQF